MSRAVSLKGLLALAVLLGLAASPAHACFGARLRVGVGEGREAALAAYATGYYVEEKAGIEPDFVSLGDSPERGLTQGEVDLCLMPVRQQPPPTVVTRDAGEVPGLGPARFWIHPEVLDDLRFSTVERVLERSSLFFSGAAYRDAAGSSESPRRAARQAVLGAQ